MVATGRTRSWKGGNGKKGKAVTEAAVSREDKKFRKGGENEGPCGVRDAQGWQIQDTSLRPEARSRASPPGNPSSGARRSNRSPRPDLGDDPAVVTLSPASRCGRCPGSWSARPTG